jgi:hypothetical protein
MDEPMGGAMDGPMAGRLHSLTQRLETDPESVERDLFKLVLTVVELVRQLMEAQALRRVEEGDLTDEQVEGLGRASCTSRRPWTSSRLATI